MESQEGSEMVAHGGKESELFEQNGRGDEGLPTDNITFRQKMKNPDYSRKFWRTICVATAFWCLGLIISQKGLAFLDLQIITRTDLEAASFFFTAGSVGYLVGSLGAGVLYDKLNKSLQLLLNVLGLALCTIVLPWCSIYSSMIVINAVVAIFVGALDTACNSELASIWGNEGEMAMQFAHFMFAFGGVISPLVTEPFLTPDPRHDTDTPLSPVLNTTELNKTAVSNTASYATGNSTLQLTTDVHYAYLLSGSFPLILSVLLVVQMVMSRMQRKKEQREAQKANEVKQPLPPHLFLFVLFCFNTFYFMYCLIEDSYGDFLTTFVVKQLGWSKSNGAHIISLSWGAFAASRFSAIFVVRLLNSTKLLFVCSLCFTCSLVAFLMFSQHGVNWGVWLAAAGTGFFVGPIFPAGFTWMEEDFLRVTGRVASSIMISASAGTMINPIVLGYLMQQFTPMWFSYLMVFESLLCFCMFLFLLAFSRLYIRKHYSTRPEVIEQELEVVAPVANQSASDNTTIGNKLSSLL